MRYPLSHRAHSWDSIFITSCFFRSILAWSPNTPCSQLFSRPPSRAPPPLPLLSSLSPAFLAPGFSGQSPAQQKTPQNVSSAAMSSGIIQEELLIFLFAFTQCFVFVFSRVLFSSVAKVFPSQWQSPQGLTVFTLVGPSLRVALGHNTSSEKPQCASGWPSSADVTGSLSIDTWDCVSSGSKECPPKVE